MRCALAFIVTIVAFGVLAQDDLDLSDEAERCLRTTSIRTIKAIDDSTIAFYMRNRDVYINELPRNCPGVARYDRIAYETSGGRLCRTDRIAVIYDMSGQDLGIPCPLGDFHRADRESVELMIEAAEQGGATSPVTAESVELPVDNDTEAEILDSDVSLPLQYVE